MSYETTTANTLQSDEFIKPPLPSMLNVLTILTIIGCSILFLFSLASPALINLSKNMMDKAGTSELSPKEIADMEKGRVALELTEQHMVPLMALSIVGIVLCFIGALMMRKLKKDGYWLYLAGQVVPFLGGLFILGTAQFSGFSSFLIPIISLVFIILYTTQRKYLVK
jgi:hypothetical protein